LLFPCIKFHKLPHLVSDSVIGVLMAEPIADFTAACFTIILFYTRFKKALKKIDGYST